MFNTIEDALESLVGLATSDLNIEIEKPDKTILFSIGRQVSRGKALTDRQRDLILEKLKYYKVPFEDNLRRPLREIDRRKYIKVVNTADVYKDKVYESYKSDWKWIKIRFPFNKRDVIDVQEVAFKSNDTHLHEAKSHEHFFNLNENNVYELLTRFVKRDFEIDSELLEYFNKVKDIIENPDSYYPYVDEAGIHNTLEKTKVAAEKELGRTQDNLLLYKDRSLKYGFKNVYNFKTDSILTEKLVCRNLNSVLVRKNEYSLKDIVESLKELKRLPLLVLVNGLEDIQTVHNLFGNSYTHSVLYRMENDSDGIKFNSYVRDNNLNTPLDKMPDILYTKYKGFKLPKPLIKSNWQPNSMLAFDCTYMGRANSFYSMCDLIISYEDTVSYFNRNYEVI